MILSAGFGTRLRPLSDERPKPLVPIGDRTLLEHVLDRLASSGLVPAVVNAHHLVEVFIDFTKGWGRIAEVIREPAIRGTAGGVAGARGVLAEGPVLVTNADVLSSFDGPDLLSRAPEQGLCLAVMPRAAGSGSVGLGAAGRVVRLRGERFGEELTGGDYVGTMAIGASALAALPATGCLIGDVALPLLRRGGPVVAAGLSGTWSAPGDGIAEYLDANLAWLAARGAGGSALVAENARVSPGVSPVSSVIGAGAEVVGSGRLERVVVWPGARAVAPLVDAVVTTAGRVVVRPPR
jgi:mannose-1-phosphate guanylyltransferase